MTNEDNVIDVEAVELEDTPNLPAVVEEQWTAEAMEADTVTRGNGKTYTPKPGRTADGVSLDAAAVAKHDAALAANPERRCVATTSKGQCRKFAILGSTVCKTHGGATKQVVNKARVRVQNASNKLMGKLIEFAFDDTKPPDTQLRAMRDALDRAGLKPPAEVVLSQGEPKPWEEVYEGLSSVSREESRAQRGYEGASGSLIDGIGTDASPASADTPKHQSASGSTEYGAVDFSDIETQAPSRSAPDESPSHAGHDREPQSDSRERPRSQRVQHVTGMLAIEEANRANRAIGALPSPSDLPGGHRRYPRW